MGKKLRATGLGAGVTAALVLGGIGVAFGTLTPQGNALPANVAYAAESETAIQVELNGKAITFDVQPQILNDRTYVPVAKLLEALGAGVRWDGENRVAYGEKDGLTLRIPVDQKVISVQDHTLSMDVPTVIVEGRTLVSLRFAAEALGAAVKWVPGETANRIVMTHDYNTMIDWMVNKTIPASDDPMTHQRAEIVFEWLLIGQKKGLLPPFTGEEVPAGREWHYHYGNFEDVNDLWSDLYYKYPDFEIREKKFIKTKNYRIQKHDWFGNNKVLFQGYAVWDTSVAPSKYDRNFQGVEKAHYLPNQFSN